MKPLDGAEAKAICLRCPIRERCLAEARRTDTAVTQPRLLLACLRIEGTESEGSRMSLADDWRNPLHIYHPGCTVDHCPDHNPELCYCNGHEPIPPGDLDECVLPGEWHHLEDGCRHWCEACADVAREDAAIERADAIRKGDW